jgi:hypothetical protein
MVTDKNIVHGSGVARSAAIRIVADDRARRDRPYHSHDVYTRGFLQFITQAADEAVTFDGDVVALASRARNGDNDAVAELIRAYAAIACLTGIWLRPSWLPMPDAAQEAMLVLRRLIVDGSITIATELPSAIAAMFARLRRPPDPG